MIYTVGGIKGGSGKTTVATNLAVLLNHAGRDVLLVDADDQESATDFTTWRSETLLGNVGYTAVQLSGVNVRREVAALAHAVRSHWGIESAPQTRTRRRFMMN